MTPSIELLTYLRSYQKWVEDGATGGNFHRGAGLCNQPPTKELYQELEQLLHQDFPENYTFPFGGEALYVRLCRGYKQHTNQMRLDWIKQKLQIPQGLRWFLSDWLAWAEAGGEGRPYIRKFGLCSNVEYFARHNGLSSKIEDEVFIQLMDRLTIDFDGDTMFPFGVEAYNSGLTHCTQHKNRKRLAWVKEKLS